MAIQFRCPGCTRPIEVDDIHADRSATCPYCRRVIAVPAESDLGMPEITPARLGEDAPERDTATEGFSRVSPPPIPPAPQGLHIGPSWTYRDQVARTYGNYALICTVLAIVIMIGTTIYSFSIVQKLMNEQSISQPSADPAAMQKISEQLRTDHPELSAGPLGAFFFGAVGLILGIISLSHSRRENWRGILAVVLCGLFVLGFCGILIMTMFLMGVA